MDWHESWRCRTKFFLAKYSYWFWEVICSTSSLLSAMFVAEIPTKSLDAICLICTAVMIGFLSVYHSADNLSTASPFPIDIPVQKKEMWDSVNLVNAFSSKINNRCHTSGLPVVHLFRLKRGQFKSNEWMNKEWTKLWWRLADCLNW